MPAPLRDLPNPDSRIRPGRTRLRAPLSVMAVACVYIVMGVVGFTYHLKELDSQQPFRNDFVWVELVRLLAVVAGVFMLRRHNWARWLALAWMGYHVVLSAFHTVPELVMHGVFFVLFAWLLWTAPARRYFDESLPTSKENNHG